MPAPEIDTYLPLRRVRLGGRIAITPDIKLVLGAFSIMFVFFVVSITMHMINYSREFVNTLDCGKARLDKYARILSI